MKIKVLLILAAVAAGLYFLYKKYAAGVAVTETTPLSVVSPIMQTAPKAVVSENGGYYARIGGSDLEKKIFAEQKAAAAAIKAKNDFENLIRTTDPYKNNTVLKIDVPVLNKVTSELPAALKSVKTLALVPESEIQIAARAVTLSNAAALAAQKAEALAKVVKTPANIAAAKQATRNLTSMTRKANLSVDKLTNVNYRL